MQEEASPIEHLQSIFNQIFGGGSFSQEEGSYFFLELKSIFLSFIDELVLNEKQLFSNHFSKALFIVNKYRIDAEVKLKFYFLLKIFKSKRISKKLSKADYLSICSMIADVLSHFYDEKIELTNIRNQFENESKIFKYFIHKKSKDTRITTLERVIVDSRSGGDEYMLVCFSGNDLVSISFEEYWKEIPKITNRGTILNCFDLEQVESSAFRTTKNSLVVIEPDYLFDVTEIASSFTKKGFNAYYYFVNQFFDEQSHSIHSYFGSLVNFVFDELLSQEQVKIDELIEKNIKRKILTFFVLEREEPNIYGFLKSNLEVHFENLKKLLPYFKNFSFQIEPTFFSADYGLLGRMDLFLESLSDSSNKTVVELKSGSCPQSPVRFQLSDGVSFYAPIWHSHYAQATGYNLLADSVYESRKGSSMILYSKDSVAPLREAVNEINIKREFLKARNWIYSLETQIIKKNYSIFDTLIRKLPLANDLVSSKLPRVREIFASMPEEYKKLLFNFYSFILNENRISKIGDIFSNGQYCQSSLWNDSFEEKIQSQSVLTDLVLDKERSSFENFHLIFRKTSTTPELTSLRKADPVVIYPKDIVYHKNAFQLFKGVIKELNQNEIKVSLRNKLTNLSFFKGERHWCVEPDYIDSTTKYVLASLFNFFANSKERIDLLLGLKKPWIERNPEARKFFANSVYKEVLSKAVEAYPYYVIQGPPGSGKTRTFVKELIWYYLFHTSENILVLAYTNRAVDEIVELLLKNGFVDFIRLGSKESSPNQEQMLSVISENLTIEEVRKKVNSCRLFLSTVLSLHLTAELLELKQFSVAIIDEASQILIPHILGLVAKFEKFILIGDEMQLSCVIQQNPRFTKVNDPDIEKLGITDLGQSYFELLINNLNRIGASEFISMLEYQYRMHPSLVEPINLLFYNNKVKVVPDRNSNKTIGKCIEDFLKIWGFRPDQRIIFVDSPIEPHKKINKFQSYAIAGTVDYFYSKYGAYDENLIGVVSPFRLQNAQIYGFLSENAKSVITVDTIERFQGSEREIILLSFPYSNVKQLKSLHPKNTFLNGCNVDKKLNVSLTRARELLLIFGNADLLKNNQLFAWLIEYLNQKGQIISIIDYLGGLNLTEK